ncbi:DUF2785 domain-containing protein [uncultured Lactobacillus sp.]|uniref:DUF2785 domain-containing protein n=1 Tax=uncultured Lactobacillus sp. TaxID=153152 RepID=UPI0028043421|nr:DUF2785 domain-containing protein [uncultured Lactobacillus sp.]
MKDTTVTIKNTLEQKLDNQSAKYTNEEVKWLFEHIGDSDNLIRDNLVCNSLGSALFEEKFSLHQVDFLIEQLEINNTLFYRMDKQGQATLTRSFACLLWDLLIRVNNDYDSKYFGILSKSTEIKAFKDLIKYLSLEQDFTGYSTKYGWVHAVAHCSDALADGIKSDNFDSKLTTLLLSSTSKMLIKVDKRFIDGEEYRLADVFVEGIKNKKISAKAFLDWINTFDFDPYSSDLKEYHRFNNLKSFLENVYVKLNALSLLDLKIRTCIEEKFSLEY